MRFFWNVWVFDFLKFKFNYNLLCKFQGKIKLKNMFGWFDFQRPKKKKKKIKPDLFLKNCKIPFWLKLSFG
jgi:hypothetical protein